ncbi:MAG: hypothetical protein M1828_003865 [Chrysothrix sp. TS-e1954]|nr:MAG: hypothetical protein M1828_003865 [Chrysothrix sp. TS-e1954]
MSSLEESTTMGPTLDLLGFPREVRDQIYEDVLLSTTTDDEILELEQEVQRNLTRRNNEISPLEREMRASPNIDLKKCIAMKDGPENFKLSADFVCFPTLLSPDVLARRNLQVCCRQVREELDECIKRTLSRRKGRFILNVYFYGENVQHAWIDFPDHPRHCKSLVVNVYTAADMRRIELYAEHGVLMLPRREQHIVTHLTTVLQRLLAAECLQQVCPAITISLFQPSILETHMINNHTPEYYERCGNVCFHARELHFLDGTYPYHPFCFVHDIRSLLATPKEKTSEFPEEHWKLDKVRRAGPPTILCYNSKPYHPLVDSTSAGAPVPFRQRPSKIGMIFATDFRRLFKMANCPSEIRMDSTRSLCHLTVGQSTDDLYWHQRK